MTDLLATIANPRSESVPAGSRGVPFCRLTDLIESTRPEWEPRLEALFRRGHFVLGEEVASFEQEFSAFLGANFSVGVANGTDAISLSLRAARLEGEVCTTTLTASFTGIAIRAAGLKPRFVDIDEDTLQIDPVDLEQRLAPQVSAVVPVHLYGQPCPIDGSPTSQPLGD
jgi:dTDP-4-amino-4,6-dideoxygalactose transaminase